MRRPARRPQPARATDAPYDGLLAFVAERLDRRYRWDNLPLPLGILTLVGLRHRLRKRNLYDPGLPPRTPAPAAEPASGSLERTVEGRRTHPEQPLVGAAGTPFGRNTPVVPEPDLAGSTPDPEEISRKLLRRGEFQPATNLNLLAAAWLQFEVHDWFSHRVEPTDGGEPPLGLSPLTRDDRVKGKLPMFISDQTHWWDASQLYGADDAFAAAIRTADWAETGKVKSGSDLLKVIATFDRDPKKIPGDGMPNPVPNLWVGLALFHLAFAYEHNAICDALRAVYPTWTGERVYAKARLVNTAVMAKIHTVEWTAALIAHPTTVTAIRATWFGLLGEHVRRRFGRIGAKELLSGIPGSLLDDEVPYSITEDFVAVYRLHPLIPEEVTFRRADTGAEIAATKDGEGPTFRFERLASTIEERSRAIEQLEAIGCDNAWYSLGTAHPGALVLHNHPTFQPVVASGEAVDLGAVDILRTRACGVPRYNTFRRALRMKPAETFEELTCGDKDLAKEITDAYGGDIEKVDLVVGLMADYKPRGFAISDTAFRVFLLMAARRLRSDPFFTMHYRPEVYTHLGLKWIEDATMAGILRHHFPSLETALRGVDNPFVPWPDAASTKRRAAKAQA